MTIRKQQIKYYESTDLSWYNQVEKQKLLTKIQDAIFFSIRSTNEIYHRNHVENNKVGIFCNRLWQEMHRWPADDIAKYKRLIHDIHNTKKWFDVAVPNCYPSWYETKRFISLEELKEVCSMARIKAQNTVDEDIFVDLKKLENEFEHIDQINERVDKINNEAVEVMSELNRTMLTLQESYK